jgi:hypothetical protein
MILMTYIHQEMNQIPAVNIMVLVGVRMNIMFEGNHTISLNTMLAIIIAVLQCSSSSNIDCKLKSLSTY